VTVGEYIEQIRVADTDTAAYAVTREAYAEAVAKTLSVDEWNQVWIAFNRRSRGVPVTDTSDYWRGGPRDDGNWTGD